MPRSGMQRKSGLPVTSPQALQSLIPRRRRGIATDVLSAACSLETAFRLLWAIYHKVRIRMESMLEVGTHAARLNYLRWYLQPEAALRVRTRNSCRSRHAVPLRDAGRRSVGRVHVAALMLACL